MRIEEMIVYQENWNVDNQPIYILKLKKAEEAVKAQLWMQSMDKETTSKN